MASRKTSTTSRGFTLIEILVVIGMIAVLGSAILFIDLNSYRGDAFRAERDTIVTLLGQARVDALNNIGEDKHGVAFFPSDAPDSYVVFAGDSYAASSPASRQVYRGSYRVQFSPASPAEVVFGQLDGGSSYSGDITISDPNRAFIFAIAVNAEGGLSW